MGDSSEDPLLHLQNVLGGYLSREPTPKEVQDLTRTITDHLIPVAEAEVPIFVLGSYDDNDEWRLDLVKKELEKVYAERGRSAAYPFKMNDIAGFDEMWVSSDVKFRLLADVAQIIVGVVEHDRGGFVYEQGILGSNPKYQKRTVLLKRQYETREEEHEHYSAMQSAGLFSELEKTDRLLEWQDNRTLIESVDRLYERV